MDANRRNTVAAVFVWIGGIALLLLCIWCMTNIIGCYLGIVGLFKGGTTYEEREVGDFTVRFYDDHCDISGTTEQGKSKRFLVIPEYIDGVRVDCFGVKRHTITSIDNVDYPFINSSVLEKVYVEGATKIYPYLPSNSRSPYFKKIIFLTAEPSLIDALDISAYFPRSVYEQDEAMNKDSRKRPANVSFYYNYEDAANNGYYWIDDCDYGGKIEYTPKEPTRKGYTFGGWYKEEECISPWDFENDTLPEEQFEEKEFIKNTLTVVREVTVYQETILYAKWIES